MAGAASAAAPPAPPPTLAELPALAATPREDTAGSALPPLLLWEGSADVDAFVLVPWFGCGGAPMAMANLFVLGFCWRTSGFADLATENTRNRQRDVITSFRETLFNQSSYRLRSRRMGDGRQEGEARNATLGDRTGSNNRQQQHWRRCRERNQILSQ
jgi:hypothetical protein